MCKERYLHFYHKGELRSNLKKRSVFGGMSALAGQGSMFVIQLISTAFLARLLVPEQFGIIAMVMAITAFVSLFRDIGLTTALIQKETITHEQVSTLFWINIFFGLFLSLGVALLAPVISIFYNEPSLTRITLVLSPTFLISSISIVPQSLLRRQLLIGRLSLIEVIAKLFSVCAALFIAWRFKSYWALVAMHFCFPLFVTIGVFLVAGWFPGGVFRWRSVQGFLKFGAGIAGFNIVNYFSRNLDKLLIGRMIGAADLGLYSKAYQLLLLPITQIRGPVISTGVPALSALIDDPVRYRKYYLNIIQLMAFVSMPLSVFLMICSNEVVLLLLGENWLRSVELFRVMSIVAFFQPTLSAAMALAVLPLGHSRKYFNLGLIRSVIVSVSICVGVCFGVNGVALAYAIATCISMTVLLPFYLDGSPVKPLFLLSSLWKPLFGSFFSGCLLYLIKMEFFSDMKITLRFGACLLSFAVLYLCLMFIFIKDKKKFASMLRR